MRGGAGRAEGASAFPLLSFVRFFLVLSISLGVFSPLESCSRYLFYIITRFLRCGTDALVAPRTADGTGRARPPSRGPFGAPGARTHPRVRCSFFPLQFALFRRPGAAGLRRRRARGEETELPPPALGRGRPGAEVPRGGPELRDGVDRALLGGREGKGGEMTKHRGSTPFPGSPGAAARSVRPGAPASPGAAAPRAWVPGAPCGRSPGRAPRSRPRRFLTRPSGQGRGGREQNPARISRRGGAGRGARGGSSAPPPTAAPSGARPRGAGRGGAARGGAGRAPLRGDPGRALRRARCRRPPGLRREPIRGRLPARGAEGTQERRGRRSLPP